MVSDLEDVCPKHLPTGRAAHELRLLRALGVSGEQDGAPAEPNPDHERVVVGGAIDDGRRARREDLDDRAANRVRST